MTQTSLFETDICARNHGGNPASQEAFDEIRPKLKNLRMVILGYASRHKDVTVKGVTRDLRIIHQTASARLSELVRDGYLVRTERKRAGCYVLQITQNGIGLLAAAN